MLSPADRDLIRRDAGIPGLATLLDPHALRHEIEKARPDSRWIDFDFDYVRYKPGQNCLARLRASSAGSQEPVTGYAKAYRRDDTAKLSKAAARESYPGCAGAGRILLPGLATEVCFLPNDNKLEFLPQLLCPGTQSPLLRRLQPDGIDWSMGRLHELNYKPERRYVALLQIDGAGPIVIRLYSEAEYQRATPKLPGNGISAEVELPCLIGRSHGRRALAQSWVHGSSLNTLLPNAPGLSQSLESVGAAIAAFHAGQIPRGRPRRSSDGHARRLKTTGAMLGVLCPDLCEAAAALATSLAAGLVALPSAGSLIHGDLHPRQIAIQSGNVGFIDLDESAEGDPAYDLGLLLAHLERDSLVLGWNPDLASHWAELLLDGYERQGGCVNRHSVDIHRAAGLFQLLVHHFRHRAVDWPEHIARGLARTRQLLAGAQARGIPAAAR
jgi:tRNA A-37 threonylcarbamoyl transferase component Bud32